MTGSRPQTGRRSFLHLSIDPSPYGDDQKVSISPGSTSPPSSPYVSIASSGTTPTSEGSDWVIYSVLCLFDFESHDPDHLPFNKNEILDIVKQEESGWWAAIRPGGKQIGWVPKAFVQPLTVEMTEKLRTVREELRVFEYEAEQLYNSAPIAHLRNLFDVDPSLSSSSTLDGDWPTPETNKLIAPTHLSAPRLTPRSAYYDDEDVKLRPPPSPMTPMPQPPPSKSAPLSVNKPIPPIPPGEDINHICFQRSRSVSDALPTNSWNIRRRPDDRGSLARLSTLFESSDIPELDSPMDMECRPSITRTSRSTSEKIRQITGSDDALAFHNAKQAMINLPWFLRPNYPPEHIIMDKDFNIRAGTLNALVERLTADHLTTAQETSFRNVFFMTFRTFATPDQVFDLLTELYRMEPPANLTQVELREWREKRFRPSQKRVLTALTAWLEDHRLLQEEPHIAQRLTDFLCQIVEPHPLALTAKLILQSLERLTFADPNATVQHTVHPRKRRKTKPHRGELLRVDPTDIAEQLCLMEHALYAKVQPQECLNWTKTQMGKGVEGLYAFCATHDKLAAWVKMSILENEALGKRSDTVDFWIKVAEKCRILNNYASMSALINALSSTAISRLHLTWVHVGRRSTLETLLKHNEPTGGFSGYRALLLAADGPCVPFIGMFLTDIVHIQDQFGDCISPTAANPDKSLICYVKRQRWYDVITNMLRHQQKQYNFAECESTKSFIETQLQAASTKDSAWFWTKSQDVQHTELAHADIRRGLVEAGF